MPRPGPRRRAETGEGGQQRPSPSAAPYAAVRDCGGRRDVRRHVRRPLPAGTNVYNKFSLYTSRIHIHARPPVSDINANAKKRWGGKCQCIARRDALYKYNLYKSCLIYINHARGANRRRSPLLRHGQRSQIYRKYKKMLVFRYECMYIYICWIKR